jgi:hypothetical protein
MRLSDAQLRKSGVHLIQQQFATFLEHECLQAGVASMLSFSLDASIQRALKVNIPQCHGKI